MGDPFNLQRFVDAQARECSYPQVLRELGEGRKQGHWIWWIFPQLKDLGMTTYANHYGITSMEEARAYLAHPVLGPRLRECARRLATSQALRPITLIVGQIDALKVRSSMTLFAAAADDDPARADFKAVLDRFYGGEADARTLEMLNRARAPAQSGLSTSSIRPEHQLNQA